jgi:hypothetical protein
MAKMPTAMPKTPPVMPISSDFTSPEMRSRADERRKRVGELLADTAPDRLVILGDLGFLRDQPFLDETLDRARELIEGFAVQCHARPPLETVGGHADSRRGGRLRGRTAIPLCKIMFRDRRSEYRLGRRLAATARLL